MRISVLIIGVLATASAISEAAPRRKAPRPAKKEPAKPEPAKPDEIPIKEPAKDEPAKAEPAKDEPKKAEPSFLGPHKTTIDVVLRAKPGEKQAAVAKLAAGTAVVVDKEDGRWLRVRAGKYTGYLTRTTVSEPPAPPPAPVVPAADPLASRTDAPRPAPAEGGPRRSWSADRVSATKAGSGGLVVGIAAPTAAAYAEPRTDAAKLADLRRGTRLPVIDATTEGWVHVRTEDGRDAYVARGDVDNATAGIAITGAVADGPARRAGDTLVRPAGRGLVVRATAAVGYRSLGMDFSSNGTAGLANYLVSADASAADVAVDVTTKLAALRTGLDARVQLGTSSPGSGIVYTGPSRAGGDIPFSTFAADAGVRAGLHRRVFDVALRAGLHYDAFIAKEVANAGRLPREQLVGATLGARVEIAPPSRVNVDLRVDALAYGKRGQTAGLEDGTSSDAGAVWAGATIRILIRRHLSVLSAYDFGRITTSWSGMSVRSPGVTSAHRVDSTQTVQVGLAAEL